MDRFWLGGPNHEATPVTTDVLRWDLHYMAWGARVKSRWEELILNGQRRLLFICGAGFDPRALAAVSTLVDAGANVAECRLIEFGSGSGLPAAEEVARAESHRSQLRQIFTGTSLKTVVVATRNREGRSTGGINISAEFRDAQTYAGYSDVVVDITALPAELYFSLIGTLLTIWHSVSAQALGLGNLHVVVCDNPLVDSMILPEGGDKAELMYGFTGNVHRASIGDPIPIWAPVLGENQGEHLQKIAEHHRPQVVAPVLPFPANSPRRGDDLLLEYRSLMFETWNVDPSDIIFADEQNPFDVYAKLCAFASDYEESLSSIGTTQMIVSSHSSKLHSLGILLAAWERRFGVTHIQPTGHVVDGSFGTEHEKGELFDIWLAGEPYA